MFRHACKMLGGTCLEGPRSTVPVGPRQELDKGKNPNGAAMQRAKDGFEASSSGDRLGTGYRTGSE